MHQPQFSRVLLLLVALCTLSLVGCSTSSNNSTADTPEPMGVQWLINVLTPTPQNTVATLDTLAQQFLTQGQHALAEQHYRQALLIREHAWGPEHPKVAPGLDHLADMYSTQGKYATAEPLIQNALAIRENALGAEHRDVATSLERYAALLRQLQRDPEAQQLAARAQAIRTRLAQTKRNSS